MTDETDAIKESAKAVQEVAKTTGQAIQFAEFIVKFIACPLEEGIGIFHDKLKYMRWERQVRFRKRSEDLLNELGLSNPSRPVPMKIAIPLIWAASLEEDDDLQDRWAKLLVNAGNANSGVVVKRSYISILEDLSPMDAKILEKICSVGLIDEAILTYKLPDEAVISQSDNFDAEPSQDVQLSLSNLMRLGCITSAMYLGGRLNLAEVQPTLLGCCLVEACTLQNKKNEQVVGD
jgi:hypothetical protein